MNDSDKFSLPEKLPVEEPLPDTEVKEYLVGAWKYEKSIPTERKYTLSLRQIIAVQNQTIAELRSGPKSFPSGFKVFLMKIRI
ncbi:MAG: hypothetical protein LBO66_11710 [Deltaproteobacteria bacterium]|jgi:hypothetical protein|nr:hypothetical protein [Deltaproteobacteria bacterium]